MNGHLGLIHAIIPATVDIRVSIPEDHPSTRNLGSERTGSGTIVDPEGHILTVNYVVTGASSITVTVSEGEEYPGEIVSQDLDSGLALLKIPARGLPFLKPATDPAALGQATLIVASSGNNERKVSGGYVTSLEPYDGHWEYMLDRTVRVTAVNPGFGGGTLANFKGEMLGVVSLNLADVGKFSLAIPISYYLDQEQAFKQRSLVSQKPWLGFYPHLLAGHVVVGGVTEGSPADRHGLKEGDIILDVERTQIRSRRQLYQELWKKRPGERISLRVLRNETSIELN
ncbi:MAG TPA: trypsin-like peptidase domain-containing protein, partial [Candidatus Polarisedimenticolaceae bacterium]|nr:trypsin-like peptidase domain-containing protein [Candidatus Polarisedimenticolaceae bacterium]